MLGWFDNLEFVHGELVHLIWLAIALVVALWFLETYGRDVLGRFVSSVMQHRLSVRLTVEQRLARSAFILGFFVLGIFGLMRPQTPGETQTVSTGRVAADIMIVLDVSRSMLADDAAPTRLERAKADVAEMVDSMRGHRVGLVAFAGRASVLSPLTSDYSFFRSILDNVDTRSVSRGGTKIGTALRKAITTFEPGPGGRLVLLITDGEDHDSFPMEAADMAVEAGVRIVAIGIGSEEGTEINLVDPDTGARTLLTDNDGNPVISRLDGQLLRNIALETEGAYVPAGTAALDMQSIVDDHLEPLAREDAGTGTERAVPREHYVWFVLGALISLFIAVFIGASPSRSELS